MSTEATETSLLRLLMLFALLFDLKWERPIFLLISFPVLVIFILFEKVLLVLLGIFLIDFVYLNI